MKKIIHIIIVMLQILLGIGAYLVQDFSMKRMGMMRYVIVQNRQWELQFSISMIQKIIIAIFVIITLLIIFLELRKKQNSPAKAKVFITAETTILTGVIIAFIHFNTTESYRSYYFICLFFIFIMSLQYVKQLLYSLKTKNHQK